MADKTKKHFSKNQRQPVHHNNSVASYIEQQIRGATASKPPLPAVFWTSIGDMFKNTPK